MRMPSFLVGVAIATLTSPGLAVQPVDPGTVQALRQMAIEAGQTSSSAIKPAAKSREAIEAERQSIDRHRAEFFARAYSPRPFSVSGQGAAPSPGASLPLPTRIEAARPVDRETVQALRRMAVEAGQSSTSAGKPVPRSAEAIAAERQSIDRHRADFFGRAYGGKAVM
ncbi:MAG: hypothetical protein ACE5GS_10520 [Kiloniellaceae bacterium]